LTSAASSSHSLTNEEYGGPGTYGLLLMFYVKRWILTPWAADGGQQDISLVVLEMVIQLQGNPEVLKQ